MPLSSLEEKGATFAEAFSQHQETIFHHLLRMVGNADDAYDLTLTSFEKAYRAWERRPSEPEQVRAWLYRIATNTCLDELRRRRVLQWQPWDTSSEPVPTHQIARDDPEREVMRAEAASLVRYALARLPDRYRACLLLRENEGLSCEQIASGLGMTTGAVRVTLFRARTKLREAYLELGGEPLD